MGRIFIGLVKCGAWGCFDEFNRLEEAVLSAVSMQIQTIQASIRNRVPTTELLGREVSRRSCAAMWPSWDTANVEWVLYEASGIGTISALEFTKNAQN